MADRKSSLSPSQQKLFNEMQQVNDGRIEGLLTPHLPAQREVQLNTNHRTNDSAIGNRCRIMAERRDIVSNPYAQSLIRIKARQLCRRADFSRSDLEDLHQQMRWHLLKVAHQFDPERASLETFIAHAIESCVRMILRDRWRDKRRVDRTYVSLERTEIAGVEGSVPLWSVLRSEDQARRTSNAEHDPIDDIDQREAFAHAFSCLSSEQRELAIQVMEHRKAGAARLRGTSRRQVDNQLLAMREVFVAAGLGIN